MLWSSIDEFGGWGPSCWAQGISLLNFQNVFSESTKKVKFVPKIIFSDNVE